MLKPAHASSNSELVFAERVVKHFPTSAINAVMREPSFPRHCDVSAVVRDDCTFNWPLVDEVGRRNLHMVPERDIGGYSCQIWKVVTTVDHEAGACLHQRTRYVGRQEAASDGAPGHLHRIETVVVVTQHQELGAATNPKGLFDAKKPSLFVRLGKLPVCAKAGGSRFAVHTPHGPTILVPSEQAVPVGRVRQCSQLPRRRGVWTQLVRKRNVARVVSRSIHIDLATAAADCQQREPRIDCSFDALVSIGLGRVEAVAAKDGGIYTVFFGNLLNSKCSSIAGNPT